MAPDSVNEILPRTRSVKILGAGAWGSALYELISENGISVTMWNRTPKPGVSTSLTESLHHDSHVIIAISVQHVGSLCHTLVSENIHPRVIWIASKGLDCQSGQTLCALVQGFFPTATIGVFSGPNIASELTHHLPCGMTIA